MNRVIEVVILPGGETRVQAKGFRGATCQEATRFLEQTLGAKIRDQLTPEFHLSRQDSHRVQQQG